MNTTLSGKSPRRRGLYLSRTKRKALRRRRQPALRYWTFLTRCFTSLRRRPAFPLIRAFKRLRTAFGALAMACWLPALAQADTFTVTTSSDTSAEDDGALTLREAIVLANENPGPDTIDFTDDLSGAVIKLTQGELAISDDLSIDASGLEEAPIIDADGKSRVMHFTEPEGDLELTKLTLRNGRPGGGHGGGVLFASNGSLILVASIVSDHFVQNGNGGGLFSRGTITLQDSTVSDNVCMGIGFNVSGEGGYSYGIGGGIYSAGTLTINDSTISGNWGNGGGGGVHSQSGSVTVKRSTITQNRSSTGGGIFFGVSGGAVKLSNSIIAGNFTTRSYPGSPAVVTSPSDLSFPVPFTPTLEVSHCLIGTSEGARLDEAQLNENNLIDVDPRLAPLADNGGPTLTHALLPDSPAIDQGNATGTDQRGRPRIDNLTLDNAEGGNGSDIGAFELPNAAIVSRPGDVSDGDYSKGNLTLREAIALTNADPQLDEILFHPDLSGKVIELSEGELVVTDTLHIDASNLAAAPVIDACGKSRVLQFAAPAGNLELTQLTLRHGKTSADNQPGGGILFASNGELIISRTTLSGNSTGGEDSHGGAIFSATGNLTLLSSTLSGNATAGINSGGGALAAGSGQVNLSSCTISDNTASGMGGGVRGGSGLLVLRNSLIAGNLDQGAAPDLAAPDNPAENLQVSYSLIGNGSGTRLDEAAIDHKNLIDVDPLLEALTSNGGPTPTHALAEGSPALDQGNDTEADQGGFPRIDDVNLTNAMGGNGSDIGAQERRHSAFVVSEASDITDSDFSPGNLSLREAITLANQHAGLDEIGFSIDLTGAVIKLTQGELAISDDLNINASDLAAAPIFDADEKSRVMHFTESEGDLSLTKLTLRNGKTRDGRSGGGILFTSSGTLTLNNSTVSGNSTGSYSAGGGIHSGAGAITLNHSVISDNSMGQYSVGGGIHSGAGSITLNHSVVRSNSGGDGGGISTSSGAVTLTNSTISGNSGSYGGGILAYSGAVTLTNSTISGNSGGGISSSGGAVTLTNSTISGNSGLFGGGILAYSGAVTLTSSTISGNSSRRNLGGGIGGGYGALSLSNSIIAGNSDRGNASDIKAPDDPAAKLEVFHCLIGNSTGARLDEALLNENNLIDVDPLLAPLADNGGPTQTVVPYPESPVINAGASTGHNADQRGLAHLGAPDIGAVEFQGTSDLHRLLPLDHDGDGSSYQIEKAVGTNPFVADPNDPRLLQRPIFNADGQAVLSFGIAETSLPGSRWILERTTDLRTFEAIHRFDGAEHLAYEGRPVNITETETGVTIIDEAPPAGRVFYRLRISLDE